MEPLNLKNHKHISPVGDYYFGLTKDGDFATCILGKDAEGKDYFLDITRHEMSMLFKGFHEAQQKYDFNDGYKSELS